MFNLVFSWFGIGNFYIIFVILTGSLEDVFSFAKYINIVLNYCYLALLIICFLLALGNRPQGSKWGYTLAVVGCELSLVGDSVRVADSANRF